MSSTVGAGLSEGCQGKYAWRRQLQQQKKTGKKSHPNYQHGVEDSEIPRELRVMRGDRIPCGFLCQRL